MNTLTRGEVLHLLRKRGLTWRQCSEWYAQRGRRYSIHALAMAYLRWRRLDLPPPEECDLDATHPLIHHPSLVDLL